MNIKFIIVVIAIIVITTLTISFQISSNNLEEQNFKSEQKFFNFNLDYKNFDLVQLDINSIFKIYGIKDDYVIEDNVRRYLKLSFELDDENPSKYTNLMNTDANTIVIFPIFTASAYNSPGFYDYYFDRCDESCLTVPIKLILRTEMGGNGAQILKLLNYKFLSDIDIDKNPQILKNFDKVILLHNEYVTKREFDAITSHPNVVYLYPNALYAEVEVNYEEKTISLIKGHNFPTPDISNGFDWKFDNTTYEHDTECNNWEFYKIDNGKMLNCYPEEQLYEDEHLLLALKEL